MIEINVNPKPIYTPLHLQPIYRVAQVVLILNYTTGSSKSATISMLQTIAWSMRDERNLQVLLDFKDDIRHNLVPWCFEPALDRALIIAIINGYCERLTGGKIKLTKTGKKLIGTIEENDYFQDQINSLKRIGDVSKLLGYKQNWGLR